MITLYGVTNYSTLSVRISYYYSTYRSHSYISYILQLLLPANSFYFPNPLPNLFPFIYSLI